MAEEREPLKYITTPVRLEYDYSAGDAASMFLRGLKEKKIIGARSRPGEPIMVPPRGADPKCRGTIKAIHPTSERFALSIVFVLHIASPLLLFRLSFFLL